MPTILQLRRGTTTEHSSFTGAVGEVTINTTKDTAVVHDGSTAGGFELLRADLNNFSGDTDDVTEGSSNLYFTNARVDSEIDSYLTNGSGISISSGTISVDTSTIATRTYVDTAVAGKDNTDEITEGSTNLYFTEARARAAISSGTGISISNGQISIGQSVGTTDNVTFNNLTVDGNLTVSGTTTTVNTETINLADNTITLNSNATGSASENAGIEIERGDDTNKTLLWDESNDRWTVGSESFVAGTFIGNVTGDVTGDITGVGTLSSGSTAPTVAEGTNNTTIATTEFVMRAIATLQAAQYAGASS